MSDYILPELLPNILARLPVEDVLRCTSVCKLWYSLITSPYFASLHFKLSSLNQEPRLLLEYRKDEHESCDPIYSLRRDNDTFEEIAVVDFSYRGPWSKVDCINGVYCFLYIGEGTIVLWNPSLRKSLLLHTPKVFSGTPYTRMTENRIGFGFIPAKNEYKILCFFHGHKTENPAQVYDLTTGDWHDLKFEEDIIVDVEFPCVHLNGFLHWYSSNRDSYNFEKFICSFDLENEKFDFLSVPKCVLGDGASVFPSKFRESLSLIESSAENILHIWVMMEYGRHESWQKLFAVNKNHLKLTDDLLFRHNWELLCGRYFNETRTGKVELVSYDCSNNQLRNLGVHAESRDYFSCSAYTYADNLLLINGSNNIFKIVGKILGQRKLVEVGKESNNADGTFLRRVM